MNVNLNIYSLILAAGAADRFGALKQLAEYQDQSLVMRALLLADEVTDSRTVLVVGAGWQQVVKACGSACPFIVRNEHFESGMASSIACGVRAVMPVADSVLILLADQPLITAGHLLALQDAWLGSPESIVATEFDDVTGAPAIFPSSFFDALSGIGGDRGARSIIKNSDEVVIRIPFADAAIDIDTPSDLERL